jgi:hypothetical protein
MSCCGQKRDEAARAARLTNFVTQRDERSRFAPAGAGPTPGIAFSTPDPKLLVTLRYRSRSPVIVRGSSTGKRYHFTGGGSMQAVDRRDAEALLATSLFERIWSA